MQLQRFRSHDGTTKFAYREQNNDAEKPDTVKRETDQPVPEELAEKFQEFAPWIASFLEFDRDPDWQQNNPITVLELDFKYKSEGMGLVLKGKRELPDSATEHAVNTPLKVAGRDNEETRLPEELKVKANSFAAEAIKWIRDLENAPDAQQNMFEEEEEAEAEPAPA